MRRPVRTRIPLAIPLFAPVVLTKAVVQFSSQRCMVSMARALAFLLFLALSTGALSAKSPSSALVDRDYVAALATADRFLHCWQSRDQESGILMLGDRLKRRVSEDVVRDFFTTAGARASYEIGRGKRLSSGRYSFPVSLFAGGSQNGRKWLRPQSSALMVARSGKNDWVIEKLP
jgi:hypothetical protein